MNTATTALSDMLDRYTCKTINDNRNALKEIIQELALLGLWRAKFFEQAAFYGGTALRILYGLDRFSENLDFSLLERQTDFSLEVYENAIMTELNSFGLDATVQRKVQRKAKSARNTCEELKLLRGGEWLGSSGQKQSAKSSSANESAFNKAGTTTHLLKIGVPYRLVKGIHREEILEVKLEVDTDPPPAFSTEAKFLLKPLPFSVLTYRLPDLFAGKLHAVLCRHWKHPVKGRDWYDLTWFIGRKVPVNLAHLETRLRQSGHYQFEDKLSRERLIKLLEARIGRLDVEQAKADILPFISDTSRVEVWSAGFFLAVVHQIEGAE